MPRRGVRVVMVTGDHPATALAVAREAGIADPGPQRLVTGPELEAMTREQVLEAVRQACVFARVVPEQKLVLVEALQAQGEVVAVTGDGVNDGPALRRAEVGVAMGSGTEVAREASAVVLLDDNFATVVAAVEEGRVVFDNVRKFVRYLFTTNVAELWTVLAASLAGLPFPLYPLRVLRINLVTDGPPALALSVEPPEGDVMRRPPRRPREPLLTPGHAVHVVWVGLLMGIATLAVGAYFYRRGGQRGRRRCSPPSRWRSSSTCTRCAAPSPCGAGPRPTPPSRFPYLRARCCWRRWCTCRPSRRTSTPRP